MSTTVFHPFRGKLGLAADGCFHRRGGLALKLTVGRSVVVVYRASAGMRKGADGGHTD